jgi:hypothetical protein
MSNYRDQSRLAIGKLALGFSFPFLYFKESQKLSLQGFKSDAASTCTGITFP